VNSSRSATDTHGASSFWMWVLVGVAAGTTGVSGQDDRPRLLLNTGEPVGVTQALAFAPDSTSFFAAGTGKVAQRWSVGTRDGGTSPAATLIQTLHWEIARGHRGSVYALAVAPRQDRLAWAGYSARDASGDIVLHDTAAGRFERVLVAHRGVVVHLAFSPNGNRLVSVGMDGESYLWESPAWKPRQITTPDGVQAAARPAVFFSDNELVMPRRSQARSTAAQLVIRDLSSINSSPRVLSPPYAEPISALCVDRSLTRFALADGRGELYRGSRTAMAARKLPAKASAAVRALAWGRDGELVLARQPRAGQPARIEYWDADAETLLDSRDVPGRAPHLLVSASGDGQFAVAAATEPTGLMLFPLRNADGSRRPRPFSQGKGLRLRSSSSGYDMIAFSANGSYRLGMGTQSPPDTDGFSGSTGTISRSFEPHTGRMAAITPQGDEWLTPTSNAGDWSLALDGPQSHRVLLRRADTVVGQVDLDPAGQGVPRCFCWLFDEQGRTYGVAIGTGNEHGVFVYALPRNRECRLLRYFRDHQGDVTSLTVSRDGKYLASASADQTIKIWSLAGIQPQAAEFPRRAAWGADFQEREGRVEVVALEPAGIAASRELRVGETLVALRYYRDGQVVATSQPGEMLHALSSAPLWQNYLFSLQTPGEASVRRVLVVPGWEPLLTLFAHGDGEWAAWTPAGYYDASVNGDELFGWLINRGRLVEPQFYRADQFREDLERPEVIRRLLEQGSLQDALSATSARPPAHATTSQLVVSLAEQVPHIEIVDPAPNALLAKGSPLKTTARIQVPAGQNSEDYEVRCYVNGISSGTAQRDVQRDSLLYRWQMAPPNRQNRVLVTAERKGAGGSARYAYADVFARAEPVSRKHRLHLLLLAADDYPGTFRLNFPVRDATELIDVLRKHSGELYELTTVKVLTNSQITRTSVDAAVTEFRSRISADHAEDLLLVFIAGHGIANDDEYYFVPPAEGISDLAGAATEVGISWQTLRRLADLPCRKLFLLDTCYAGNIVLSESDAEFHWKTAMRPLRRAEALVVSATSEGQYSWEDPDLKHGVFTYCALEAMLGRADGLSRFTDLEPEVDRTIDLAELVHYLVREVPKRTQGLQTPRHTTSYLGFLPLVKY